MAIFAVTITYGDTDARDRARPSHREYLQSQFDSGTLISSGPFADGAGALIVYESESESALQNILDQDPYWQTPGVLGGVTIKEWNRHFCRC